MVYLVKEALVPGPAHLLTQICQGGGVMPCLDMKSLDMARRQWPCVVATQDSTKEPRTWAGAGLSCGFQVLPHLASNKSVSVQAS